MTKTAALKATRFATKWLKDNGYGRSTGVARLVRESTDLAIITGTAHVLALCGDNTPTNEVIRAAIAANPNLKG